MVDRRRWRWGVLFCLIVTVTIVALDLRDETRRKTDAHAPLKAGAAHLDSIPIRGSAFSDEDFSLTDADLAVLEEGSNETDPIDLLNDERSRDSSGANPPVVPPERSLPAELPLSESVPAVPLLTPNQLKANTAAIRNVYPDASDEQVEFWLKETLGLPPDMIMEMLRLRKQIGPLAEAFEPKILKKTPESIPREESTLRTLREARDIVLQNLANSETVGYLRTEVHLVDDIAGKGRRTLKIAEQTLSDDPGKIVETGEPLDVACGKSVFLQVVHNGREYVTRYGHLKVGAGRQLQLSIDGTEIVISPGISIAADSSELRITNRGLVQSRSQEAGVGTDFGQLTLVAIPEPQYLNPAGNSLYVPTERSGKPVVLEGEDLLNALRPGSLELSNVNWNREQELLKRFDWLIEQSAH